MIQPTSKQQIKVKEIAVIKGNAVSAEYVFVALAVLGFTILIWIGILCLNVTQPGRILLHIGIFTIAALAFSFLVVLIGYLQNNKELNAFNQANYDNAHHLRKVLAELYNLQQLIIKLQKPSLVIMQALEKSNPTDLDVISAKSASHQLTHMIGIHSPTYIEPTNNSYSQTNFIYLRKWLIDKTASITLLAEKFGFHFIMDCSDDNLPQVIKSDPTLLLSILTNLIGIIIKRTGSNSRKTVLCIVSKSGYNRISILVTNESARIGDQTSFVSDKSAKELGIEMEIVKNLVDDFGGITQIHKHLKDIAISVFLPYETNESPVNLYNATREIKTECFKTINLLIFDGDKERSTQLARYIKENLAPQSIDLFNFASTTILDRLIYKPTLIILDNALPGTSGIEFLPEIKKHPKTKDAIVIASSSSSKEIVKDTFLREGAFLYLQKPITYELIKEALYEAVSYDITRK